jgi:hypothetical protein
MKLARKIALLQELNSYLGSDAPAWQAAKAEATRMNAWFLPRFIDKAVDSIRQAYLPPAAEAVHAMLEGSAASAHAAGIYDDWIERYALPEERQSPLTVGLTMAGNIPLVGFHDMLCVFLSGHRQRIKPSSKDDVLIRHIVEWMHGQDPESREWIRFSEMLKGCDAYIATGSDNSARYFEYYFAKYPYIIRRNRTSVAILDGTETPEELSALADDIQRYFGLGCRNVTQLQVPEGYDFVPLLEALKAYDFFLEHHKYRHNFDYYLTIQIMNNQFYMTNGSVVLTENPSPFSPIGQVHYQFYRQKDSLSVDPEQIQCLVGHGHTPFGQAQRPRLDDFADGVDTMRFLAELGK